MLEKFFLRYPNVTIVAKPSSSQFLKYKNELPEPVLSLWQEYGFGIFMDGYLRLINPEEYQEFADSYIENIGFDSIPFAVSCFGDLFVWAKKKEGQIDFYNYRHGKSSLLAKSNNLHLLFGKRLIEDDYVWEKLDCPNYYEIVSRLGLPSYDQCYGYFPLLALGGSESVDKIQIVDLRTHMDLMAQATGPL